MMDKVQKSEQEWRDQLSKEQFFVTRLKGTERPFSGKFNRLKAAGTYKCVACGNELFSSDTKYDSGSGWPSFWAPVDAGNVATERDVSFGVERIEVHCDRCGAHLGHRFPDGPNPTGQRYCMNSASLRLDRDDDGDDDS